MTKILIFFILGQHTSSFFFLLFFQLEKGQDDRYIGNSITYTPKKTRLTMVDKTNTVFWIQADIENTSEKSKKLCHQYRFFMSCHTPFFNPLTSPRIEAPNRSLWGYQLDYSPKEARQKHFRRGQFIFVD